MDYSEQSADTSSKIAVLTTRYVMKENSPILFVYRDDEGDWQFMGKEDVAEADAMIVTLGQILVRDSTIKTVLAMPPGHSASRVEEGGNWIISKDE